MSTLADSPDRPGLSAADQELCARLEERRSEMLELATELVAIPTENPPGREYARCAERLKLALAALDLAPELVEAPGDGDDPPAPSVIGTAGSRGQALVFHGHYDVVPAQSPAQFAPARGGGRLVGRGSADMKSGVAAMIHAAAAVRDAGLLARHRLRLHLVPDEETGGGRGSRPLAEAGLLTDGVLGMLTPEPTGGVVWNANRGAISLRATVHGREAHVGLAHRGVNAFEGMLEIATELAALRREVAVRRTAYGLADDAGRGSILLLGGQSSSGSNFNVVPSRCTFTVDRRPNPEEDLAEERARLLEVFDRARRRGWRVDVDVLQDEPAAGVSEDEPLARELAGAVHDIEGRPPRFEMCPGLLEIRWYAQRGVAAFAYGPGRLEVSHGADEWVDEEAVVRCAQVYAVAAARTLGQ